MLINVNDEIKKIEQEAATQLSVAHNEELLEQFRLLNEQFAAGDVSEEDFEYRKAEVFAQLGLGEHGAQVGHRLTGAGAH